MKKIALLVLGAALVGAQFSQAQDDSADRGATSAPAATQPAGDGSGKVDSGKVDASDADAVKAAAGQRVILVGTIENAAWSSSGKVMKATFKGNEKLSLVVFQSKKDALDKAFSGDLASAMNGAKVEVTGLLKQFNNKPEMVIDDAKQLKIVQASATTQSSQSSQ